MIATKRILKEKKAMVLFMQSLQAFLGIAVFLLFFSVNASAVATVQDQNAVLDKNMAKFPVVLQAERELANAKETITKLRRAQLPIQRVSDSLLIAKTALESELETAAEKKREPELTMFRQRIKEFNDISSLAFTSHDELEALKSRIDKASEEISDVKPALELYEQAQKELKEQRFERVMDFIEKADEKLIDLASLQTRAGAMYDAAAANISGFVASHQTEIALAIGIPLVVGLVFHRQIKQYRLRAKIGALELEKKILQEELKKAQQQYFVEGKISEGAYTTRISAFGDLTRELTRQIALLHEEQQRINTAKPLSLAKKIPETPKGMD